MSSAFRRRTIGRAASPPTWACYEQIYDDSGSGSDSSDDEDSSPDLAHQSQGNEAHDVDAMDLDDNDSAQKKDADIKGKQRALDPEPESPRRSRHRKERVRTLRPILTIHRSQGFVWNQDLFIPPYIKDRYVASTSPPNSTGFLSTSASSTLSALNDYEVEVVEIRVQEGDLDTIIP